MRRRGKQGDLHGMADAYLARLDPEGRRFKTRAVAAWRDVAGPEIARHTTGSALREGELVVFVDSAVWANELSLMSEHLRERLNEALGEDLVRSVRFAVSRKVTEETERRREEHEARTYFLEDDVESVPLSDTERAQVDFAAAGIRDAALREAAVRAMTKHLEWKKGIRARNARQKPSE